jgi:hypothetical protein
MEEKVLIAISVTSLKRNPYPVSGPFYDATIRGESTVREARFTFEANMLNAERAQRCQEIISHGFTVVERPTDWQYGYYNTPGGWQAVVIQRAMDQVAARFEKDKDKEKMSEYDPELAEAVLEILNQAFPNNIQLIDIKHRLKEEPSDEALLTALDALLLEGLADGKPLRSHTTGRRNLVSMANIQITSAGRKHLSAPTAPATVFRDQYINLGQAGAMGQHAQGVVNTHAESSSAELLANFRAEVTKLVADQSKRDGILARVEELETAQDRPSRVEIYLRLMGAIGDHITVLGLMLPPILHWVQTAPITS